MFCENCGSSVDSSNMICPNCGTPVISNQTINNNHINLKTTGVLIFAIIELLCINPIFGLISLILYFTSLQPAIKSGNLELAQQKKKTIKTLLIIGLVLGIILTIFYSTLIIATILPMADTTSNVAESAISDIESLRSLMQY